MSVIDKLFGKLYRYDENLKNYVPTKWAFVLTAAIIIIFVTIEAISISKFHAELEPSYFITIQKPFDTMYMKQASVDHDAINWDSIWLCKDVALVENENGFSNWNTTDCEMHTISHVDCPYYMFKKADNDTLVIIKDNNVLKFILPASENYEYHIRPKSFSEFKENVKKGFKERYE